MQNLSCLRSNILQENIFTHVFREADCQRGLGDFLCKQIFLVKEEDYRCVCKPLVVADGIKQLHALHHTVLENKEQSFQKCQ